MYNRYIPQPDGSYHKNRISEPEAKQPQPHKTPQKYPPASQPKRDPAPHLKYDPPPSVKEPPPQKESLVGFFKNLLPKTMDTGDLIIILLLLLMANDCEEDRNHALLTLALYFIL